MAHSLLLVGKSNLFRDRGTEFHQTIRFRDYQVVQLLDVPYNLLKSPAESTKHRRFPVPRFLVLGPADLTRLRQGQSVTLTEVPKTAEAAVFDEAGGFVAVVAIADGVLRPAKVFN